MKAADSAKSAGAKGVVSVSVARSQAETFGCRAWVQIHALQADELRFACL
jgi:hypothetical protein